MADQRTMDELLRAPTEGYAEVIVVSPILAKHFELKHSLINMMTSDKFFGLEKDNPHDHIRWFNKITSTIKYKDVPNLAIKLMLFPFSLSGEARRWFEKEPPRSILTWEDLVSKFINEFFPPSKGQIFEMKFPTFNNADQDSLNSAVGGNLLERRTQDVLTIIKNKSKVRNSGNKSIVSKEKSSDANSSSSSEIAKLTHAVNQQTSDMTTAMTAILKQFQATPPPASVKAETLKRRWRYLVPAESHIHNCMLIPNYQDIKYQDFRYSDELSNLGRVDPINFDPKGERFLTSFALTNSSASLYCMRTRSSSNLPGESSPNLTSSIPTRHNRRRSKKPFIVEESIDTMAHQHTIVELLRAPTEGYAEAIVVPPILAEHFELKHCLVNMMTSDQFFGLEKDNPHGHIHCAVTTAMIAILKQFQATLPLASVKDIEEICVTCGGAHPYYQCLVADGNTFPELRDNIQGYVLAATFNYNQVVPLSEHEKIKKMNEINMKAMQTHINNVKNELRNEMKNLIQASISNQTNELKNMMACFFQINTASTSGSGPLPSNIIANPKGELKAITTRSGIIHDGPSVPMPPQFINPKEDEHVEETLTDPELDEFTIKLPEKLGDLGRFLVPCGFSKLKCKSLTDLAAGIARDAFVSVGKFTFLANFVIVDYESDPRVPLILGRPFLWTARALIDVHGEEMILFKGDIFVPEGDIVLDSTKDLPPPHNIIPLSGSTTFSSLNYLLEEFAGELALITFPTRNDDLPFDIEFDLKEKEYLLNRDPTKEMDYILEDSIDEDNLTKANVNLVDTIPKMFTDEHTLDYSSPPLYDEYDDDLDEFESDINDAYNDPFDSKGEKIKESKLLIDELDLPRSSDFLPSPEYDSFLFEDFSEVDALPSTNNEDKVFNLGILILKNLFEVLTRVAPDKNVNKLAISHASLILEDFDPPLFDYELPFHKKVLSSETLLSFSSKNEEKVFKPGILTSTEVHSSLLLKLSHQGHKVFKVIKILESLMEIFPCSFGEDIRILDVPCLHFYPP
nr:reverse transcriptase domain-containing protein [Tanacetum cinerariifolium]